MSSREGGHGGYRQPANPAAVSGPGASSARTDGGPGNQRQPLRVPTGGRYGEAKALEDQQRGAPLPDATGSGMAVQETTGGSPPTTVEGRVPEEELDVFRPTEQPDTPLDYQARAGLMGQGPQPSADAVLTQLVESFPSPYLIRLLQNRRG